MPTAIVRIATIENPGLLPSARIACLKSDMEKLEVRSLKFEAGATDLPAQSTGKCVGFAADAGRPWDARVPRSDQVLAPELDAWRRARLLTSDCTLAATPLG